MQLSQINQFKSLSKIWKELYNQRLEANNKKMSPELTELKSCIHELDLVISDVMEDYRG